MVLPVRIELTASPLPRECSTTELRQRFSGFGRPERLRSRSLRRQQNTRSEAAEPVEAGGHCHKPFPPASSKAQVPARICMSSTVFESIAGRMPDHDKECRGQRVLR